MTEEFVINNDKRNKLYQKLQNKLETTTKLNRKLVSFQANKDIPIYRLFKYKEGFSSQLVKYFLNEYFDKKGKVFDPFAGAGTTLFASQEIGWDSCGIELLPVGIKVMETREAFKKMNKSKFNKTIETIWNDIEKGETQIYIKHIPITEFAFPDETEDYLNKFLTYTNQIGDKNIKRVLEFAAFSVLEEISYTRKDGQYLRWDHRSKRQLRGKPFNKGKIKPFKEAVKEKINQIKQDLIGQEIPSLFPKEKIEIGQTEIISGTCLERLPEIQSESIDCIITSPPYCNRYDYTRTYALELVYLGLNNEEVRNLRQTMLSCTVENKEKTAHIRNIYAKHKNEKAFDTVTSVYHKSEAMEEVNSFLNELNLNGKLNNKGISRMVKNYFLEMCFVIYELARVTKKGGYCIMVNDNVRYAGEEIPVDLLLSEFASNFGFEIVKILVLQKGKGNSSQQMGEYGRTEIRKCVYIWQKK